mmetsp:Transcript_93524/g.238073  ORF Transcript_93524/g.238073 Transcript_93524/m.238073 type:complete len:449 (-) Transcript_93524:35-1381(-)
MVGTATCVGLAACACFMFAVMGAERLRPKSHRPSCFVVLVIWFWSTTIWASSAKRLLDAPGGGHAQAPACWRLTMLPHLLSCGPLLGIVVLQEGACILKEHFLTLFREASWETLCWYIAGGCYFYGQLFTVLALTGASPLVVMVVKALEPLVTASLAILALGQEVRWPLLVGILVACGGIILAITGASEGGGPLLSQRGLHASVAAACLANLGFGSRACMVKRAYSRSRIQPLLAISTITLTGVVMGAVPLLFCPALTTPPAARSVEVGAMTAEGTPHRYGLWFATSVSYLVYQTASLFLLEAFAVESHALLVSVKHVVTALSATLMVGGHLSSSTLLGSAVTLVGIGLYTASPAPPPSVTASAKQVAAEPPEAQALTLRSGGASHQGAASGRGDRPPLLLLVICMALMVCGTVELGAGQTTSVVVTLLRRAQQPGFADAVAPPGLHG